MEYSKQMKELLSKPKKKKETKKDFLKDKVDTDLIDSDDEENNETNDSENNIAEISDRLVDARVIRGGEPEIAQKVIEGDLSHVGICM